MSGNAAQCNQGQLGIRIVVNSQLFCTFGGVMVWGIFYWHTFSLPSVVTDHVMTNSTNFSIFRDELISLSSLEIIKAQMKYSTSPILYSSVYPAYMVFKRWIQCYWFILIIFHCIFVLCLCALFCVCVVVTLLGDMTVWQRLQWPKRTEACICLNAKWGENHCWKKCRGVIEYSAFCHCIRLGMNLA